MYDYWKIDGLRGVGDVLLKFLPNRNVRVIFGPNGIGKTKCLEAIFQSLILTNKEFYSEITALGWNKDWAIFRSVSIDGNSVIDIKGPGASPVTSVVRPMPGQNFHHFPVVFLGAQQRSLIGDKVKDVKLLGSFEARRKDYFMSLHGAIINKKYAAVGMSQNVESWFVSRAQSVNPYQKISDNRKIEIDVVMRLLNAIDSRIDGDSLEIDGSGRVYIKIDGNLRELGELSSGFASLIKMVQAIISGYANFTNAVDLQNVRGIVLIDEIESHLHAEWQSKIVPRLKEMLPNTIFFIATHSPLVLSQLNEGEAFVLNRNENGLVTSTPIDSPNKRGFVDVLESGFGVDLNALKRESMLHEDQTSAKAKLLDLLAGKKD